MYYRALLLAAACVGSGAHAAEKVAVKLQPTPGSSQAGLSAQLGNQAACSQLLGAIESGEKELAALRAEGFLENSAPRETTRQLAKLGEQQRQTQNLMMMTALQCPNLPVGRLRDGWRYYGSALECRNATGDKDKAKLACARENWAPSRMTDDPQ